MICENCSKETENGYRENGIFKCVSCSRDEKWYRNMVKWRDEDLREIKAELKEQDENEAKELHENELTDCGHYG